MAAGGKIYRPHYVAPSRADPDAWTCMRVSVRIYMHVISYTYIHICTCTYTRVPGGPPPWEAGQPNPRSDMLEEAQFEAALAASGRVGSGPANEAG